VTGDEAPLIRTLHAGDGFLSQSTAWLHFGLGQPQDNAFTATAIVHWPGGETEAFPGLTANRFHLLTQGKNSPELWETPKTQIDLSDAPSDLPASPSTARIVLTAPLPLPQLDV